MNINKLKELLDNNKGELVVKNYPTLCEILEVERKGGKGKIYQLKELATHCSYEQQGQKFIIKEFYGMKLDKVDNRGKSEGSRGNNKGVFKEDMLNTLLYMCITIANEENLYSDNGDDFVITTSRHDLLCDLGMRNRHNNYVANVQPNNFCSTLNVERGTFDYIMGKVRDNSHSALKGILDTLTKSGLAIKRDTMKVVKVEGGKTTRTFANEDEYVQISHIKRKVATSMGYKNESMIHATNNAKIRGEFYSKVNELTKEKLGILEHYPMIKLHMNKSNIDQYLQKFEGVTLEELVEIGNEKFLNQQKKTLKSSQTKYLNGKASKNKLAYVQLFDSYEADSKVIVQHLIDVFAPKIELNDSGDAKLDHATNTYILD